jgi:hypothetical protein
MVRFADNPRLQLAYNFIENTGNNIFLTGKAGTGKTTFLKELQKISPKRMVVVAPTGVAAINAGGVTIHSFFQMHFGPHEPSSGHRNDLVETQAGQASQPHFRMGREKRNIIRSLDLLVIDEISMVRADLLDGVDETLRRVRRRNEPFGGVQLLMIGDMQQLPPVVKEDEWEVIRKYYTTPFFFGSRALQEAGFISIELKHIYRQHDEEFISLLGKIRDNKLDNLAMQQLGSRTIEGFKPGDHEGYIILTTHNAQAQSINESKLKALKGREHVFIATIEGEFPEYSYPTNEKLILKTGAQVMFIKNDSSGLKQYYNGKIGKIEYIEDEYIKIRCEGETDLITVEETVWQNMKYGLNESTKEIEEVPIGSFKQLPLKLAWAITIHKSQGLTFDKAVIDARAAFAHGQVYVALSRCRTLEGLVLSSPISHSGIITNSIINKFSKTIEENTPGDSQLLQAKINYEKLLIKELLDFSIIARQTSYCLIISRDHAGSLLENPSGHFETIRQIVQKELSAISSRFLLQVEELSAAQVLTRENDILQERIKKACVYFNNQLNEKIFPVVNKIRIETDNRAVKKSLQQAFEILQNETTIKAECLKVCCDGFETKKYLEARAKAAIEKPEKRNEIKVEAETSNAGIAHTELFNELRSWRSYQAELQSLPHYMILSQKALMALAQFLPVSTQELKRIKGIGNKTIEKYGEELLEIIQLYRHENKIDTTMPESATAKKAKPKNKPDTKALSYQMFKDGKSVKEIATERQIAVSTVEGHLAHYVGNGQLEITSLVSGEKIERISNFFVRAETTNLGPAKETLGEEVSYAELRYVLKHLQHTGKLDDQKLA